jgi:hypothetical protein
MKNCQSDSRSGAVIKRIPVNLVVKNGYKASDIAEGPR